MIRINLLGVERQKIKAAAFDISQHAGTLCAVILVLASAGTGGWYWLLRPSIVTAPPSCLRSVSQSMSGMLRLM